MVKERTTGIITDCVHLTILVLVGLENNCFRNGFYIIRRICGCGCLRCEDGSDPSLQWFSLVFISETISDLLDLILFCFTNKWIIYIFSLISS
jgi:hypothetical protein